MSAANAFDWLDKPGVKDALASGMSHSAVARLAGVVHQTVANYRNKHLKPAADMLAKAQSFDALVKDVSDGKDLAATLARNPFLSQLAELRGECLEGIKDAKRAVRVVIDPDTGEERIVGRDFSVLAPIIGQAHKNLELYGKGTGLFNDQTPTTSVTMNIVIMAPDGVAGPVSAGIGSDDSQTIGVEAEE